MSRFIHHPRGSTALFALAMLAASLPRSGGAAPSVVDRALTVVPVVTGLNAPTSVAFLGTNDLLVLSKNTGQVRRITGGVDQGAVLDLGVNFASERGLLGIALDPGFPAPPYVYLYWTASSTGVDTNALSSVALLGNRVDRFLWNGAALVFDRNLVPLRARQTDNVETPNHLGTANAAELGNHNGGVIRFGPDGKLYVFVGDVGRRGWLQNLPNGPFLSSPFVDDTFGGPAPDNAHLAGVVLRLNNDGSVPADNPFFAVGAAIGGESGANIQRIYSYGHRNGFGMAFDPTGGRLWLDEDGEDAASELNLVTPGMNGGWTQIMGPLSRLADFKTIETTFGALSLEQLRWSPTRIADTSADALARLFALPGSTYRDPQLSWTWEIAPGGLGFLAGTAFGPRREGNLFMGAATPLLENGYLFRIPLTAARTGIRVTDPALQDGVADNLAKHDLTESESLLFGRDFGVVTDIQTGPNGNLFVVSLSQGAIYEIRRGAPKTPGNKDQLKCQVGTSKALAGFVDAKTRCVAGCLVAARKGKGALADCFPPYAGDTAACIQDPAKGAEAKARTKIAKACVKDCPSCYAASGNCPDGAAFVPALEAVVDATSPQVFCREAAGDAPTKPEAKCEDGVSKHLGKFERSRAKCVASCITQAFKGKVAGADCAGPSFQDPGTLACVGKASLKAVASIDDACSAPAGAVPACHGSATGATWIALGDSDVDDQTPQTFCGP